MSSEHVSIEDIQETHLSTYRSNPDRIESDAGTERQDRADYDGRFIFELLQNAVDEMADTGDPAVRMELSDDSLIVANNGSPFTIDDLYALTLTTRTTKAGDTSIGHKGRGFTSVLGITDRPAVFSSSVAARFDRSTTTDILSEDPEIKEAFPDGLSASDVPVLGMPSEATPSSTVEVLLEEGYTTVFEFPLRNPAELRGRIERKLRSLDANTVALLPELKRIRIDCPEWERTWQVEREAVDDYSDTSLVHLTRNTETEGGTEHETRSFIIFETDAVDRSAIVDRTNLSKVEVDTMGQLSVGVGFKAEPASEDPSTSPSDWRLAPVYGDAEDQPPHVHVFLPTKERSPIPALVTGTFQSDTSRRNLTLDYDDKRGYEGQFNAALFAELGGLLAEKVVPFVDASATTTAEFLETHDPSLNGTREWSFTPGSVEHCLFEEITKHVPTVPFIPTHCGETARPIEQLVLPHTAPDTDHLGAGFAKLVDDEYVEAGNETGYLPSAELLTHQTTTTLQSLGATRLSPEVIPQSLDAASADPPLREHIGDRPPGQAGTGESDGTADGPVRLWVDPVLVHLVEIRKSLDSDEERDAFDASCRSACLFPTEVSSDADGILSARRMRSGDQPFFMPPEEPVSSGSLPTLAFLARELYHGTDPDAAPELRKSVLPSAFRSELKSIWRIDSFSFERVFDAAIRPVIPGPNSQDVDTTSLETLETLTTIRKMARVESRDTDREPTDPLLYRSSRRPFFELSKLPIPAVPLGGGSVEWKPAHRVYVAQEWQAAIGREDHAQVEPLLTAVDDRAITERFDPWFLAPLEWFDLDHSDTAQIEEWIAFFRWLGVAEHVRPLPLFAPDAATRHRYRKTKGFQRSPRSAVSLSDDLVASDETDTPVDPRYSGLSNEEWGTYRKHLLDNVDPELDVEEHGYLYQVNPLEYAEEIITAAETDESVGKYLLNHLSTWWDAGLGSHQYALAAEFTNDRWRGSNRPYFFDPEEHRPAGANLWVWQLRQRDWVPTSQGAVAPPHSWLLSTDDRERFSLQLDRSRSLLPFIESLQPADSGTETSEEFTSAFGIGTTLERDQFSPADTERVLTRIRDHLRNASVEPARFAGEVELLYTRVAELLPGLERESIADSEWYPEQTGLDAAPVLCRSSDTYKFLPASEAYFVRSHTERERYENLDLPLIVLFKPEAARFGVHLGATDTTEVITKTPLPGDDIGLPVYVDGTKIDEEWVKTVLVALLLRLRSDRPSAAAVDQDTSNTRRFFQQIEIVDGLDLELETEASSARFSGDTRPQPYHIVRDGKTKSAVLIDGSLPPAEFVDAIARAYTDYLDVPQYYEGVYNLLDHAFGEPSPEGLLTERLRVVGNGVRSDQFDVVRNRLFGADEDVIVTYDETDDTEPDDELDAATDVKRDPPANEKKESAGSGSASRSSRVPDIGALKRIGERKIYEPESPGRSSAGATGRQKARHGSGETSTSGGGATPASQEYRSKIDDFGMALTIESERDRLRKMGEDDREMKVWDVSTPQTYGDALGNTEFVERAIDNFLEEAGIPENESPFDTDWPGFDVLTIATDEAGEPVIDRCIELKTSGLKTRKPSLSWNEWKAAGSTLTDRYYLYVARNIRVGKSGDATLLEIPRPFQTLIKHRRERREREVQLDLRSFDLDDEPITERPIEWEE